jgi:hypothetical protein
MSVWVVFYFMCKDNPPNCESMEHVFKFTILSRRCVMKALRGACAIVFVFGYRGVHKETTIGAS